MRLLLLVAGAAAFAAVAQTEGLKEMSEIIESSADLLAQESQHSGGGNSNWFDVIHNDDLWNQNIKDGPGKQMLMALQKTMNRGSRAPLAGPPPHIRPPPSYTPQKVAVQDSHEQTGGWQNNAQSWSNKPQQGGWQQQGPAPGPQGWQGPKGPAPGPQGWQGPQPGPQGGGGGKKVVILVSLPNNQQGGGYGGHGHGNGGFKQQPPVEMIEGIRQQHNNAPVVYVSLDKGGNSHSQQHFPAKGNGGWQQSHVQGPAGPAGPAGGPQKVVLLFVKEKGQGAAQGGHGGGGWVQAGGMAGHRKPGGYGGPQIEGWNDGPVNNNINVGPSYGNGGWAGPQKGFNQPQGWAKTVTASYNTGGHAHGGREKSMGYFTGQPEVIKNKIRVQGWDQPSYSGGQQQGWQPTAQYGGSQQHNGGQQGYGHNKPAPVPPKGGGGGGGGGYGRPTEPFDDELPSGPTPPQSIDNGGWQPIVTKPGTEGWVPRPTAPPNKREPSYAPKKPAPPEPAHFNRVEKTSFDQKQYSQDQQGYHHQQQQEQSHYGGQQQQQTHYGGQQHQHQQQNYGNTQQAYQQQNQHQQQQGYQSYSGNQQQHRQQSHYQQNYGTQQTFHQNQQQQDNFESYNTYGQQQQQQQQQQQSYGGHQNGSGHKPASGGGGYGRPAENFDPEDLPSPGYGGAPQANKPKQNPFQEQSWNELPAPAAAIHQHGSPQQQVKPPPPSGHPKSIQDIRNAQGWQRDGSSQDRAPAKNVAADLPKMQPWTPQYAASSQVATEDDTASTATDTVNTGTVQPPQAEKEITKPVSTHV